MALDKQKILNELGNVVNQLQSANCGCLDNLFEKAAAVPQHVTHGHAHPSSGGHHHCSPGSHGDPNAVHNQAHNQCNHHCHPAKVYGDTQNYLNNNIVQPIVNEVYEELKSITPENTIVNTALVNQMGLHQPGVQQGNQLKFEQNNLPNQSNYGYIPQNNTHIKPSYGQHAQGMAKFKEMFPGVTGQGDLGYDPMEIALQMNPANRQNTANNAAQKLINKVSAMNKPNKYELPMNNFKQANIPQTHNPSNTFAETNAYANSVPVAESNVKSFGMNPAQHNMYGNQQPSQESNFNNNGVVYQTGLQAYPVMSGQPLLQSQVLNDQTNQSNPIPSNCLIPSEMAVMNPISENEPATQMVPVTGNYQGSNQLTFPIEATNYQYNTLGQPVEMLPANAYRLPKLTLPQTLSPQPIPLNYSNSAKYSNVKSTVSKTSLMGIKSEGGTPSRSKLQRMYNEYKGSQSFVPQHTNVAYGMTHSDGKLNVNNCKETNNFHIEKTGGDTMLNNEMIQKLEGSGQVGDAPASDKPNNGITEKPSPNIENKGRNGLQDMVFTSYPSSTAWSFHGR